MHSKQDKDLVTALSHMHTLTYMNIASLSVLFYDYCLTLPLEVETVWLARWTTTKFLFLLTRYLPFIDMSLAVIPQILPHATQELCETANQCAAWMFITGIALAEIILTIRAWAVWEQDRRLTIGLPIFFIVCWAPAFAITGVFLRALKYRPDYEAELAGCYIVGGSPILFLTWVMLMIYESGIGVLMGLKGVQSYRISGDTGLFRAVYRDGIVYYLYLAALSVTNVVIVITLPNGYAPLLTSMERAIHAILTCRVLLQLRHEVAKRTIIMEGVSLTQSIDVTGPMVFAPNIISNLT